MKIWIIATEVTNSMHQIWSGRWYRLRCGISMSRSAFGLISVAWKSESLKEARNFLVSLPLPDYQRGPWSLCHVEHADPIAVIAQDSISHYWLRWLLFHFDYALRWWYQREIFFRTHLEAGREHGCRNDTATFIIMIPRLSFSNWRESNGSVWKWHLLHSQYLCKLKSHQGRADGKTELVQPSP